MGGWELLSRTKCRLRWPVLVNALHTCGASTGKALLPCLVKALAEGSQRMTLRSGLIKIQGNALSGSLTSGFAAIYKEHWTSHFKHQFKSYTFRAFSHRIYWHFTPITPLFCYGRMNPFTELHWMFWRFLFHSLLGGVKQDLTFKSSEGFSQVWLRKTRSVCPRNDRSVL